VTLQWRAAFPSGFESALSAAPVPSMSDLEQNDLAASEARIRRAVACLSDDFLRQSAFLSFDDFVRVVARCHLTKDETQAVRERLSDCGIVIPAAEAATTQLREEIGPEDGLSASPDALQLFFKDMRRYRLLNATEEIQLAQRMLAARLPSEEVDPVLLQAAEEARERFIQSNLRLVLSVANDYAWAGLDLLDLVAEGCIGLMKAVEKFDHTLGYKFSTYATHWIEQKITRAIADQGRMIRLPVHIHDEAQRLFRTIRSVERNEGRTPDDEELALLLSIPADRVAFLKEISQQTTSLDAPVGEDDDLPLVDLLPAGSSYAPDKKLLEADRRNALEGVLETLSPREREVLALRHGLSGEEPMTLEMIGQRFGLTRERIRQIEAKALVKLRHPTRLKLLKLYE